MSMLKLDRDYIQAQISALTALIASLSESDYLGRSSLEARRQDFVEKLDTLAAASENRAKIALYFGGEPAIGSAGVEAEFSGRALSNFQDLITKVWGAGAGKLPAMGRVPEKAASQLHITSLVHGSFGFLLEELDAQGEPLFETVLRKAADTAVHYVTSIAAENEARFTETLEQLDPRVFSAVRDFFSSIYHTKATLRLVEGTIDARFDRTAVERAWKRLEAAKVEEDRYTLEGQLLGIIPMGRRFEFEPDGATPVITGKVGERFSQSYLERMSTEQFAGKQWKANLHRVVVTRQGREPSERFTLLELDEIEKVQRRAPEE